MKRLAEKIAARILPSWAADSVLGDLEEEHRRVAGRRGTAAAGRWYVRQALVLTFLYGCERLRYPFRSPRGLRRSMVRVFVDFAGDSHLAIRQMARRPLFAASVILTLGVGVAANATSFSLANAVLFRSLSPDGPDRVVRITARTPRGSSSAFAYHEFVMLRDGASRLTDVGAVHLATMTIRTGGVRDQRLGELGSAAYFRLRRPRVLLGRMFVDADDTRAALPAVLLGERYWRRSFGSDPSIVGRTINVNGVDFTIAGVARADFASSFIGAPVDLWAPLEPAISFLGDGITMGSTVRPLQLLGRVAPQTSLPQAQQELGNVAAEIGRLRGDAGNVRLELVPGTVLHGRQRTMATVLLAIVVALTATVLLVAASNLANLLLARAISRRRDIALRLSLGAHRGRLVRQAAAEISVLAACAGIVGLLAARWTADAFGTVALLPGLELRLDMAPDWRIAAATMAMAVLAGLLAASAPALAVAGGDLTGCLKDGGGSVGSRQTSRLRSSLVVAQVAVAVLAAVAAGLLVKSGRIAAATDLGFRTDNTFATDIDLTLRGYTEQRSRAFYRKLLEQTAAIPGIRTAAVATRAPLDLSTPGLRVLPDDEVADNTSRRLQGLDGSYDIISPGYFETVGLPLAAGRPFDRRDTPMSTPVAIVNETLASRLWASRHPLAVIGRHFRIARSSAPDIHIDGSIEIVGVARNAKYRTIGEEPEPHVYLPAEQHPVKDMVLLVRSATPSLPIAETQSAIASVDPEVNGLFLRTLEAHTRVSLLPARFAASVSGATGTIVALLAAVGLYGLIASIVAERRREMAVRLALGATPGNVSRAVLRHGVALAGVGCLLGLGAAFLGARFLTSLLYVVSPADPLVYASVTAGVLAVAVCACWIPAHHASRTEPLAALRE